MAIIILFEYSHQATWPQSFKLNILIEPLGQITEIFNLSKIDAIKTYQVWKCKGLESYLSIAMFGRLCWVVVMVSPLSRYSTNFVSQPSFAMMSLSRTNRRVDQVSRRFLICGAWYPFSNTLGVGIDASCLASPFGHVWSFTMKYWHIQMYSMHN